MNLSPFGAAQRSCPPVKLSTAFEKPDSPMMRPDPIFSVVRPPISETTSPADSTFSRSSAP